jgi:peptidoglycan/xylan/chitin deacetylase (PgdA/CDA1 family)
MLPTGRCGAESGHGHDRVEDCSRRDAAARRLECGLYESVLIGKSDMANLKSILLKFISYEMAEKVKTALACLIYVSGFSYLYSRIVKRGATILVYHSVGNDASFNDNYIPTSRFYEQIEYLKTNYRVLPLSDLISLQSQKSENMRDMVAITFDDGYKDNFTNALPILRQFGLKATFFITTCVLSGRALFYDEIQAVLNNSKRNSIHIAVDGRTESFRLRNRTTIDEAAKRIVFLCRKKSLKEIVKVIASVQNQCAVAAESLVCNAMYLNGDEIAEMRTNGMEIGAHTVNHLCLAAIEAKLQQQEIFQSKTILETVTGDAVQTFSYPFGKPSDFNLETIELLRAMGFLCAVTTIPGYVTRESRLLELPRIGAKNASLMRFKVNLHGIPV